MMLHEELKKGDLLTVTIVYGVWNCDEICNYDLDNYRFTRHLSLHETCMFLQLLRNNFIVCLLCEGVRVVNSSAFKKMKD
jgi:hypothetical protein